MRAKILNFILAILIVIAIVLIIILGKNYSQRQQNDEELQNIAEEIKDQIKDTDLDENIPYLEYDGYQIIGIIEIPKLDLEYPILIETTEETLKKSITRVGNGEVNGIGNLSLAGHNYLNGSFFGKLNGLENGDEIIIIDLHGNEVTYNVFDKYTTEPSDASALEAVQEDTKEVTLITCTTSGAKRIIIKAREV